MDASSIKLMAVQILAFISNDPKQVEAFLAVTGSSPNAIRNNLDDLHVQAGIFDFLLSNETLLVAFCEAYDLAPEEPMRYRYHLPGAG